MGKPRLCHRLMTFEVNMKKIMSIIIFIAVIISTPSYAQEYFAFLQINDTSSGLVRIIIQKTEQKKIAQLLNKNFWRGTKTTCPHCDKEIESILTKLPSSYSGIFRNEPIEFPYLSSKKDRIIFYGVPMNDAVKACNWMTNAYKTRLNRQDAKTILPKSLTD